MKNAVLGLLMIVTSLSFGQEVNTSKVQLFKQLDFGTLTKAQADSISAHPLLSQIYIISEDSTKFTVQSGFNIYKKNGITLILPDGETPTTYRERIEAGKLKNGTKIAYVCSCSSSISDTCHFATRPNGSRWCGGENCCKQYEVRTRENGTIKTKPVN